MKRTQLTENAADAGDARDRLRLAVADAVEARQDRLVKLRRRIHATPEPSGEELQTTSLVAEILRESGLHPQVMAGGVGVIADLDLGAPSDTHVALRSELDCVVVNDDKQTPYASTRPGLCHACGHDAHSTILLSVAAVLSEVRDRMSALDLKHNVRFVFQPAEETATGARSMIQQGALAGVEAILALHVDPFLESGRIGLRTGPITSACKIFRATLRGRSGHSARPHQAVDPIPAATNLVSLFYQLAPRSIDMRHPLALTVTSIQTGASYNAIPDQAVIGGTVRAAYLDDLNAVQRRMDAVVKGVREATGCEIELEYLHSSPATDNDPLVVEAVASAAGEMLGQEGVQWLPLPSLGGEDFAFYQELIPGAMMRLGAAVPEVRARRPLHSSLFDIDESSLAVGAKVLGWSALKLAATAARQRA